VQDHLVEGFAALQAWRATTGQRIWDRLVRDESGEGVISAAIAVLIMAFLGAAAWLAFRTIFDNATESTNEQIQQIGS
jgi:hypothetical protein